jgi:hypothetical protein
MTITEAACRAIAKAVHEVRSFRDEAKALRAHARQGPDRGLENMATDIWVRAEDRMSDMIQALRETVELAKKEAGLQIDPETAEVYWQHGQILDPYGVDTDLPEECKTIGRVYFARSPGTDVWVCFDDLPEATRSVLWERLKRGDVRRDDEFPWDG